MRQVENIAHAKDERQTEGSQGINAAQQHATDEELQQRRHPASSISRWDRCVV